MLPPRPIGREPIPVRPPQSAANDGRASELEGRLIRLENDRPWLGTLLVVVVIAGVIGPLAFLWMSDRRADRYQQELALLDERVRDLDRDVIELLSAVLEEPLADDRVATSKPAAQPIAPAARGRTGGAGIAGAADGPSTQPNVADWAQALGGRILSGPLDESERTAMRSEWENLDPALQEQALTAILRSYGLDPEAFFAAIDAPARGARDH